MQFRFLEFTILITLAFEFLGDLGMDQRNRHPQYGLYLPWAVLLFLGISLGGCEFGPSVEDQVRAETREWWGVPYEWGGVSREGVDCSGFTQVVFNEVFGITLPRKAAQQERMGLPVSPDNLRAGDLVFFKTGGFFGFLTSRHVGIYLSAGKFAHAFKSQGVTISSLEEPFWRDDYHTSRRVLDESGELIQAGS